MSCQAQNNQSYYSWEYDKMERFLSYWHQIDQLRRLAPTTILEVGIGNGFVSEYLRKKNISVVTFDMEASLNPDVVGTVLQLPFKDSAFDAVLCCEILEHLPYVSFIACLKELARVSKRHFVISLPDREFAFPLRVGYSKKLFIIPRFMRRNFEINSMHQWEIGQWGLSSARLIRQIRAAGLIVKNTYRIFENPYHRFFVLVK